MLQYNIFTQMTNKMSLSTAEYLRQRQQVITIVNFDNFDVEHLTEFLPEESNCKKRKMEGRRPPKNLDFDQGLSFIHCNLVNLAGLQELANAALWNPDRLVWLNISNNKIISLEGIC